MKEHARPSLDQVRAQDVRSPQEQSVCPLCGSPDAKILVASNVTWLTECPSCVGRGVSFWVTSQAGARAAFERGDGHFIDPSRAKLLVSRRIHEGGPAYVQQTDLDDLLVSS